MASAEVDANGSPVGLAAKPSMAYLKMKGTCTAATFEQLNETNRGYFVTVGVPDPAVTHARKNGQCTVWSILMPCPKGHAGQIMQEMQVANV